MSKLTSELDNLENNKESIPKWTPEQLEYFEYLENIVNAIPKRYGTHYVTPSVSPSVTPSCIKESNDFDNLEEMVNAIPKGYSIKEPKYYIPENESKPNTFLKTQRRKKTIDDPNCKTSVNNNSVKCRSLNNILGEEGNPEEADIEIQEEDDIHIPEENNKIQEEADIEIQEEAGIHIPEENNKIQEEADIEIQEEAGIHIPEKNDYKKLDNTEPRYRKLSKTTKLKKGGNKTKRRRRRGLTRRGVRRTNNKRQRSTRLLK